MVFKHDDELLTATQVGVMFRVDPKTINRWAKAGKLPFTRTPGGQRRYWRKVMQAIIEESAT